MSLSLYMQKVDFYNGKRAKADLFLYLLAKTVTSASFTLRSPKMAVLRSGLESQGTMGKLLALNVNVITT